MEKVNAYLQITMKIKESDRQSAAKVYFDLLLSGKIFINEIN